MASSSFSRRSEDRRIALRQAVAVGDLWQGADGAALAYAETAAGSSAQTKAFSSTGIYACPKAAGVLLDGGRAYWSPSSLNVSYKRRAAGDFYLGRVVGDAASGDASCTVNLNASPPDDLDLSRDPYVSAAVGTSAAGGFSPDGGPLRRGGALRLALTATNEAQKIDALGVDPLPIALGSCVVEMAFRVTDGGVGTGDVFSCGIASATHATAVTSIAQSLCVQIKGADTKVYAESKDGTTTVSATDTTKTITVGATSSVRKEVWLDCRTPAAALVYVDGVQVLSATTFGLSAAAASWFLLAHLVKTSSTDTMAVELDWLRARTCTQRG